MHFVDDNAFYLCMDLKTIVFASSELKLFVDRLHKGIIMIPNSFY